MKRTVSTERVPEYPTVSVDSDELKDAFVNTAQELDSVNGGELYTVSFHPSLFGGDIFDRAESGYLTASVRKERETGVLESEDARIDYEVRLGEDFRRTVRNIESAVENSEFERNFWSIDGKYDGFSGNEVAESADGMALTPIMHLENDLGTDLSVGWFPKAPMDSEVQFGYKAFTEREYQDDSSGIDVLGRVLGVREDEVNQHPLTEDEVQSLLSFEEELSRNNLL